MKSLLSVRHDGVSARALTFLLCALVSLVVFALACNKTEGSGHGLLAGKTPTAIEGVQHAERLNDGVAATDGDHWETHLTAVFRRYGAYVEYDLGAPVNVDAIYVQGDNNDEFIVSGADDSKEFRPLWTARRMSQPGMRDREVRQLGEVARYLRISARGGDAAVSASEVLVYSETPPEWPPAIEKARGEQGGASDHRPLLVFAIIATLALLSHRRDWPAVARAAVIAATIVASGYALHHLVTNYPPREPDINVLRAIAAIVAAAAVVRLSVAAELAMRAFVMTTLGAMAVLAVATFYNLGEPQFEDEAAGDKTFVHTWDMRVYFPTAKYFDELGFDGLYVASVKAYADDVPGEYPRRIGHVELRDLQTYRMTRVKDVIDQIDAVKNRFSPERWEQFRSDMSYFRETMGSGGYLGSLRDHGGNATPAWLLGTHFMFRWAPATKTTLLLAAMLDPALLLLFFVAAWRTFGLPSALVCMVIYGTTTFPWFGSNWAGSTLRNDWMVLLGLGVCALKSRRFLLGGVLLAAGAMIRAFPAFAVLFLPVPALVWVAERLRTDRRLPSLKEIVEEHRPLLRATAGALACVAVLTVSSGAFFGFKHSWGTWMHKIGMHSVKPNVNHVGLRTVIAYDSKKTLGALATTGGDWSIEQMRTYRKRMPLFIACAIAYTALAVAACRRRRLEQAALFGLMLIPIWLYPSNYYLHYVFVLPLLVDPRTEDKRLWALLCAVLLGMSFAEYFGFSTRGIDERYAEWSISALVGFLVVFAAFAWQARRATEPVQPAAEPQAA